MPMTGGASSGAGGSSSGAGGTTTTGGAGGGSSGSGMGGAVPTEGCGAATWPAGDGTTLQTIDVGGTPRQYIVSIPTGYDPNHPYRLIFAWHGRTGTAAQVARNYYNLKNTLGSTTIFVSGQGLGTEADAADTGWPNTDGQDIAFVRALVTSLESSYCVDKSRIMSVGMSYGGIMSYTIACSMGDVFRAIAPIAGASFGGRGTQCVTNHVAVFAVHGTADDQVLFENGTSAKDTYVTRNHCMTTTAGEDPTACPASPTDACSCLEYQGCDAGYPVVWCTHNGGHTIPNWSGPGIATFFQRF
jgi:poly(3-hydroxybutyrate) depolymerase